ncbi:hypothetical protein A2303_01500 [Candidatus Falkowbacteria bacterium RIFOXYB2_FULL_47_14]|uniref:DUF3048 domain-containing protein n=1 Tax=Candidatus Falkowbacteria bacterium RIFOXYA2_FULL_47_19 TaxID=1797994 RepID=A0A1F5SLI3_9BACT|nr:MAG: hypothetical protein A2227_01575 [Candidatus Falkowbacteria bacterium RIFOXYA2_FULL_47_19]OGF34770.1 MAG: hypothetical protein A2468_03465 [Candidatus Falkowbacteria bacterium RIFOXYC2_FULL_46_15]OGF43460.1 MAG: hypothetical protein A2303_01500 [Candidatus Falkowbacteria bacterium RIFOXYB2_FULL_47_14]
MDNSEKKIGGENFYERMIKKKIHIYASVIIVFFMLSAGLGFVVYNMIAHGHPFGAKKEAAEPSADLVALSVQMAGQETPEADETPHTDLVRRAIDGVYVKPGEENRFPAAVMIDNNIYARPHSGLSRANVVYEAEVEGSATRYMAVFAGNEEIDEIGPVRSARAYFVDWVLELSALYVHVGGSPEALVNIKRDKVRDFNEFYNGNFFWRDWNRRAPHNVYTSSSKLAEYTTARSWAEGGFSSWQFKDEAGEADRGPDGGDIDIKFLIPSYRVRWKYDRTDNSYIRYLGGAAHIDKSGDGIKAKNIVIQYVKARVIDNELRLSMDDIGEGEAVLCFDGFCRKSTWQKKEASERTRFYDENGNEAVFNAGTTWVEVVRPGIIEVGLPEQTDGE